MFGCWLYPAIQADGEHAFRNGAFIGCISSPHPQITDAGVHLTGMTNMQNLDLNFPLITDAGVADLKKALPKCKINEK